MLLASLVVAVWMPVPGAAAPDLTAYPWLYLRDGAPLPVHAGRLGAAGEPLVELIAVGDVMLGRGVSGEPHPLAAVVPWLASADLALGNLECVVAEAGAARPGPYRLRAPLSAVATLRATGFDLLGLANNHTLDYGPQGLAETAARLQEAGVTPVGVGVDAAAAARPLIRDVGGVRLAFLAFNAVSDPEDRPEDSGWTRAGWDPVHALAAITTARAQADAVIVSIHWGYEYDLRSDPAQRDVAQAMVDAGAALVIGHHPHVVQGTDAGQGSFVAYSLGNLLFDQEQDETRYGLALRAFFDTHGLRAVQALPVWAGLHPRLMTPSEAVSLLARVSPQLRSIGFACDRAGCRPVEAPHSPPMGPFGNGEIDLTGDGVPEQVRREEGRVVISSAGAETWRSPSEWQVADLTLGDPNDDGRAELLLALFKPDAAGIVRSHPFIVGYRQGAYRVLWGGSAVTDPIREVELGDVDGDRVPELVVLDENGADQAVTVWRWHGWGFSLVWRSPPGRHHGLVLLPGQAGSPILTVFTNPY